MKIQFSRLRAILVVLFIIIKGVSLFGQTEVSGATCVIPGVSYQYIIKSSWEQTDILQVCIRGGVLSTGGQCTPAGTKPSFVTIIWSDSLLKRIDLSSSNGNSNLIIQSTTQLNAGSIEVNDTLKTYDVSIPYYVFRCTEATGGSCSPHYTYQWQKSTDGINWQNISGSVTKDLQFSGVLKITTQFRRVTAEAGSNTIAYSNAALLLVE